MKKLITVWVMSLMTIAAIAQAPAKGGPSGMGLPGGKLSGKIVNEQRAPIAQVTLNLLKITADQTTGTSREVLFKSVSSDASGQFSFTDVPVLEKLKIKISAVGYDAKDVAVAFTMPNRDSLAALPPNQAIAKIMALLQKDLGTIVLQTGSKVIDEVTVTARKALLELDIDKKIFNVEKNIASAGGTAVDVFRNMPSVQVDIDGNVKLRNAAPTIFIDGRPTTLSPNQIPADLIEKVEIITNPSAKYDASGSMAGILNIVLKKNKKTGFNGMINAGADRFGGTNVMGSLNARQNKWNISLMGMNMRMRTNVDGNSERVSDINSIQSTVNQDIESKTKGAMTFSRLGVDYDLTERTTFSLSGMIGGGKFSPYEITDITSLIGSTTSTSNRTADSERSFKPRGLQAGIVQKFKTEGEELTADFSYFGGKNNSNGLYTTSYFNSANQITGTQIQNNTGFGKNSFMTVQVDYVKPFSNGLKLETGARAQINNITNNNENSLKAVGDDQFNPIPAASSNYDSKNTVYALYASLAGEFENLFSYKVGLRGENSTYEGRLLNTGDQFNNEYPLSLFPSIFISKKLTENDQLQLSGTRRVNRPNFFQLIPFIDYTDSLNITRGNADLVPEFTTSGELTYSNSHGKGTFLASFYYKYTDNLITRFLTQEANPVTGKDDFINSYINANSSQNYGAEFTYANSIKSWWDITTDLNFYNSSIKIDANTSRDALWTFFAKMNNTFNFKKDWNLQVTFDYQGKTNMPVTQEQGFGPPMSQAQSSSQGYIKPFYGVDLAIKKSFMKSKMASVTLAANDIFRSRGNTMVSFGEGFSQNYYRLSNPQLIKLNLSFRFGKMDMNMFKKNKQQNPMEGMQI